MEFEFTYRNKTGRIRKTQRGCPVWEGLHARRDKTLPRCYNGLKKQSRRLSGYPTLLQITAQIADSDTMHSHDIDTAINMPMPRVEQAIDEVERALRVIEDASQSGAWDAQERFCLVTRTAESQLRVTWGERGGHYRPQTFKRLADLLIKGLSIISRCPPDCPDAGYNTQAARATLVGRLAWIESILADK